MVISIVDLMALKSAVWLNDEWNLINFIVVLIHRVADPLISSLERMESEERIDTGKNRSCREENVIRFQKIPEFQKKKKNNENSFKQGKQN